MGRFHNTNFSYLFDETWFWAVKVSCSINNWQDEKKVNVNEHVHAVKYFKFLYDDYRSTRMKYLYYCVMTVRRFKDEEGR